MSLRKRSVVLVLLVFASRARAQRGALDPTRALPFPPPAELHTRLPEQYLWTAGDVTAQRPDRSKFPWSRQDLRVAPHYFRAHFAVPAVPLHATLYVAGPRAAAVYLNGRKLADFHTNPDAPIGFHVFHLDVTGSLHPGDNVLAVSAVRGRGVVSGAGPVSTQQLAFGEVLVAKIVPAAFGVEAPALVRTDGAWKSSATLTAGWEGADFNDRAWLPAASLGGVEDDIDLLQWSADAGMYGWPGYRGMSSPLRTFALAPVAVTHVFPGADAFSTLDALSAGKPFRVRLAPSASTDADAPAVLFDFGREVAGRLLVESASDEDAVLSVAYGESEIEALATGLAPGQQGGNYLGTNVLEVPARGIARGPKSGFRYALVRFLRGAPVLALRSVRLEGIYYPVPQQGAFESSDPLLNSIWETGAYTAHLCMQDGLWDAPKRDRGRWVGDIDVEGRVILTAFGDATLIEDTLRRLAEATSPSQHVNGIPSYTALWLTSLEAVWMHTGNEQFLRSQRAAILRFQTRMQQDFGPDGELKAGKAWNFVDWAPGMYGQTDAARAGTELQYARGAAAAARMLRALDGAEPALKTVEELSASKDATFERVWQLDVLETLVAPTPVAASAWKPALLSHLHADPATDEPISPYFGAYALDAMSRAGIGRDALTWMRAYWGGMLAEGATSFWESYDLRWPKGANAHLSLQADGTSGYFVSLAHGWSAGPTAWLTENVLGVTPISPGYAEVQIKPQLFDLAFARGAVPTPHGLIRVDYDAQGLTLDLPSGISAHVVLPTPPHTRLYVNAVAAEDASPTLKQAGHYRIEVR